jgi:hypothetical protein
MEAPEKIYVVDTTFPDYVDFDGSPINTKRIDDHDIEYTRTDAFIEKACDFFEENIKEEDCKIGSSEWTELRAEYKSLDSFIRAFVGYMKGE